VYVADNAGDDLAAVRHINACGGPAELRAVLRPTPGAGDVATTGWDLLVAAGKPPHAARREHVTALSWGSLAITNALVPRGCPARGRS
jgi:hypothetical protein